MNVYPNNQIECMKLDSVPAVVKHSDIKFLYHPYLSVTADFQSNIATITGDAEISRQIYCDSIILANTNATMANIKLVGSSGNIIFNSGPKSFGGDVLIINLDDMAYFKSFELTISGDKNIYLGLLYFGMKISLPRFLVEPVQNIDLRNQASRSLGGQSYGLASKPLRSFSAQFMRVIKDDMKTIDNYAEQVQTVVPHFIDPYPEAHQSVKPFYATLQNGYDYTKRNENNFFYDFSLSWMEAK